MRNGIEVMSLLYLRGARQTAATVSRSIRVQHLDSESWHKGPENFPFLTFL